MIYNKSIINILVILLIIKNVFAQLDPNLCKINVNTDIHEESPLILAQLNPPVLVYPSVGPDIVIRKGQKVRFVCPAAHKMCRNRLTSTEGMMNFAGLISGNKDVFLNEVTCNGNNQFKMLMRPPRTFKLIRYKETFCTHRITPWMQATNRGCTVRPAAGRIYNLGFDLGNGHFLTTVELCYDSRNVNTFWAHSFVMPQNYEFRVTDRQTEGTFRHGIIHYNLNQNLNKNDLGNRDPPVRARIGSKGRNVEPYGKMKEWLMARLQLGTAALADQYFCPVAGRDRFLARGHLISNADMFYLSEQESTFFYANVVPMWQSLNSNPGNWYKVEEVVRKLAHYTGRRWLTWVGGQGILHLRASTRADVPFYLDPATVNGGISQIPVPRVLFKIIVNEELKQALVFVVVNNPTVTPQMAKDYLICKPESFCRKKVFEGYTKRAVPGRSGDISPDLGYLYCCSLANFYDKNAVSLELDSKLQPYTRYKMPKLDEILV